MFSAAFINNNALVFNRGATGVDNDDFDKKLSLAKTLTNIRNSSNATTDSSCCQATLKEWLLAFFFVNPFLQIHWFLNQH
jgi:hypothetical protein